MFRFMCSACQISTDIKKNRSLQPREENQQTAEEHRRESRGESRGGGDDDDYLLPTTMLHRRITYIYIVYTTYLPSYIDTYIHT